MIPEREESTSACSIVSSLTDTISQKSRTQVGRRPLMNESIAFVMIALFALIAKQEQFLLKLGNNS